MQDQLFLNWKRAQGPKGQKAKGPWTKGIGPGEMNRSFSHNLSREGSSFREIQEDLVFTLSKGEIKNSLT